MQIADLLTTEHIACNLLVHSKKRVLEIVSDLLSKNNANLDASRVFDSLLGRERLGSTGLGHGAAIPHGRVAGSSKAMGAFLQLQKPVEYDAIDNQPVDLVFALLVPTESTEVHLELLSKLARLFSDDERCERLRTAKDPQELLALLTQEKTG